jgi:hypothetical protein
MSDWYLKDRPGAPSGPHPTAALAAVLLLGVAAPGCNAIFGIKSGQPSPGGCLPARSETCDPSLESNPQDCCTLNRSCQGGTCSGGECTPVQIADDQGEEVVRILLSGDKLVWSSGAGRRLYSLSISTPGAQKSVLGIANAADFQSVAAIVTDGTYVYFNDYNGPNIGRIPLAGGPSELMVEGNPDDVFTGIDAFPQIAVAGGFVYWGAPKLGVYRVTTSAPSYPAPAQAVIMDINTYAVAADDTYFYWSSTTDTSIYRLAHAKAGQGVPGDPLVDNQGNVAALFVDDQSIYWNDSFSVWVADKRSSNQNVVKLYTETNTNPNDIYSDGRDVYWTTSAPGPDETGGGSVRRTPKIGGAVHTFAHNTATNGMAGIVGSCDTIFWLDAQILGVEKATK